MEVLLIGNDMSVRLTGLKDEVTEDFINDADVTVTVKTKSNGVNVSGQTWPTVMDYVTDSDGDYIGNLEDGLALRANVMYSVEIEAVSGSGKGFWKFNRQAVYRTP